MHRHTQTHTKDLFFIRLILSSPASKKVPHQPTEWQAITSRYKVPSLPYQILHTLRIARKWFLQDESLPQIAGWKFHLTLSEQTKKNWACWKMSTFSCIFPALFYINIGFGVLTVLLWEFQPKKKKRRKKSLSWEEDGRQRWTKPYTCSYKLESTTGMQNISQEEEIFSDSHWIVSHHSIFQAYPIPC